VRGRIRDSIRIREGTSRVKGAIPLFWSKVLLRQHSINVRKSVGRGMFGHGEISCKLFVGVSSERTRRRAGVGADQGQESSSNALRVSRWDPTLARWGLFVRSMRGLGER